MRPLAVLFCALVVAVLAVDYVFLPKSARNAWKIMAVVVSVCLAFLVFPAEFDALSFYLFKIPRGADLLIYGLISFLVRDYFISRNHMNEMQKQLHRLIREDAKVNAKTYDL